MSPAGRTRRGCQKVLLQKTVAVDSIPSVRWCSARQRSRLQTTAYLLGVRQELPDVDKEEINRIRAVRSWYSRANSDSEPSEGQLTDQEKVPAHAADHDTLEKGNVANTSCSQVTYSRCSRTISSIQDSVEHCG